MGGGGKVFGYFFKEIGWIWNSKRYLNMNISDKMLAAVFCAVVNVVLWCSVKLSLFCFVLCFCFFGWVVYIKFKESGNSQYILGNTKIMEMCLRV